MDSRITKTSLTATIFMLLGTSLSGCFWATTKSEGDALRRDVNSLDTRLATKEGELNGQIGELKKVLDDATVVLKRNSANLGADVDQLRDDIRKATGLVVEVNNGLNEIRATAIKPEARLVAIEARLDGIEARTTVAAPPTTSTGTAGAPPSAESLWNDGRTAFEAGKFDEARDAFKKLVVLFPTSDRADDAQYFRGEAYFKQAQYDNAIREYQHVVDKYPDSSLADDALFRAGEAATTLKNCSEARTYFGLLSQKYPTSNLAKKAAANDKSLKASIKDKTKCNS